jgi:hypothetical protein
MSLAAERAAMAGATGSWEDKQKRRPDICPITAEAFFSLSLTSDDA